MAEPLTVTALTYAIKSHLESSFTQVLVRGEITNFKEQSSGHFYFTLKDEGAQISCALFKGNARLLTRLPKGGEQVVLSGEISLYSPRGTYQIIVRELQYLGIGELLLKFHELKTKLEKRGWFDAKRKKPLPKNPKTIGVVTSPTGSVIQDILHILNRRYSSFHLILNPVRVQGEGAAQEIAAAIAQFNQYKLADVLIVGRGGGSLEDLWAFNEEIVAEAIYNSQIPIISAVGHETDFCLSDYVADVRAPTPSAAAEIVSEEKEQHVRHLLLTQKRLREIASSRIREAKHKIATLIKNPLIASPYNLLAKYSQILDETADEIHSCLKLQLAQKKLKLSSLQKQSQGLKPSLMIQSAKQKLNTWQKSLTHTLQNRIERRKEKLLQLSSHLQAIDPRNLLTKGYCILFSQKKESVILKLEDLQVEDKVRILVHEGEIGATVNTIKYD